MDILDWDCTVCGCDTDNCNQGNDWSGGATMTQISMVGIIAIILLSFLDQ